MFPQFDVIRTNKPDNIVFLDIETTGLSHENGDKICEIAMLRLNNGQETLMETLVNPMRQIPAEVSKINGIYNDMLTHAPEFKHIANDILGFIGNNTVICHNVPFDLGFITNELTKNAMPFPSLHYIDTLKIARTLFNFNSNALTNIAASIGLDVKIKHRAMADVQTTYQIFKYITADLYKRGVDSLEISLFTR